MTLKNAPLDERPRERMQRAGARSLSLRELIAIIFGSGTPQRSCLALAEDLLTACAQGLTGIEATERAFFTAFESGAIPAIKGLGDAKLSRILAVFELSRRYSESRARSTNLAPEKLTAKDVCHAALAGLDPVLRACAHEWLGFVPVQDDESVGEFCLVAEGSMSRVTVDARVLFLRILSQRPAAIVLFHNHPSGSLFPSEEDLALTARVAEACDILGISMLGHWIVAQASERLM